MMKSIKQSTENSSKTVVEAYLIGLGSGTLEYIDDTIKFYTEKGRIKKRQELSREIPMSEVEAINRVGDELSITWKGSMDIFVIENNEFVGTIFEKISNPPEEETIFSEDKIEPQQSNEIKQIISATMEITDPLFDILRSLHGWVDWNRIENILKESVKKAQELIDKKISWIELDFSKLTLAVTERKQEEISKQTLSLLKSLIDYFATKASENEVPKGIHPNYSDAKTTIQAHFLLNDIALGSMIDDKELGKEQQELLMTLEELVRSTKLKININAIETIVSKLHDEKGKDSIIKESRKLFKRELKELITY
jgi:hypothetical protein